MTRFKVDFDGVMDRLEELERENHRLRAEVNAGRPIIDAVAASKSVFAELDVWVLLLENSTVSYLQELIAQAQAAKEHRATPKPEGLRPFVDDPSTKWPMMG